MGLTVVQRYALRGWLAVIGGVLVHLTLGTLYTFGNMTPYITSYIRARSEPTGLRYSEGVWIFAISGGSQGAAMFLGGVFAKKIGPRLTTLLGAWIMSLGTLLTYFTIKSSFYVLLLTYGVMYGGGTGIAYANPLACGMKWLPNNKGLVNGIIVAGFGAGAFIFDQVQTAFINPGNLKPNITMYSNNEKYFGQPVVLDNIPPVFLLLGAIYAVMQLLGILLIAEPPKIQDENQKLLSSSKDDDDNCSHDNTYDITKQASSDEENHSIRADWETHITEIPSVHPRDVLKTRHFWTLWATFLVNGQGIVFFSSLYKAYGQTFIADDQFLALVGAFAAIFNGFGRIFWGHFADRFSYKSAMLIQTCSMFCLMMTLTACPYGGKPMFFIWVCLIFGTFSGNFALLPTATAKIFGPEYVAINYGLVFTAQAITGPIGAFLATALSDTIGWFGMFCIISAFTFLGFLLTITFNAKTNDGKDI
ncbi:unnamed protein product [Owenia fusiformis]|uniref:Uncharacterized protein n=1 Tax=Owenia fusiformis TaxID=6347 RepID=A0A8J1YCE7_OWEFU|nr:unnamed protein product [Owenia fusiformis]